MSEETVEDGANVGLDEILAGVDRFKSELTALEALLAVYSRIVPVVDDAYPKWRYEYDQALRSFLAIASTDAGAPAERLTFEAFSHENKVRCHSPKGFNHELGVWSLSDWFTATLGELGEAANCAKKLNRVRDGIPGNTETPQELRDKLADELADTFIYLDLIVQSAGLDMATIVSRKFDKTSRKIGYPKKLVH